MSNGVNVDITANLTRWTNSLDRATQDLTRFHSNAQRIGGSISSIFSGLGVGLSVAGFTGLIKSSIDAADHLKDLSKSTGVSISNLNGLSLIASTTGTDLDTLATTLNKFSVNLGKNGDAFKKLGIDAKDPIQAFLQLSDIFNSIDDPQKRAAFGAAVLGKNWQVAAPALSEGRRNLEGLLKTAQDLNPDIEQLAEQADQLNDQMSILSKSVGQVANRLAGDFALAINDSIAKVGELSRKVAAAFGSLSSVKSFDPKNLDDINGKIDSTTRRLENLKKAGQIRSIFGEDKDGQARIAQEQVALEQLTKARDDLIKSTATPAAVAQPGAVEALINPGGNRPTRGTRSSSGGRSSGGRSSGGIDQGQQALENLQQQIALFDQTSEAARARYETELGSLRKVSAAQKEAIVRTSERLDTYKEFDEILKQGDELAQQQRESIAATNKEAKDFLTTITDFTPPPSGEFEQRLYRIDDALKAGTISAGEAKDAYDKLGEAFNSGVFDKGSDAVDKLSEYSTQAARSIQQSFADFLFDPLNAGWEGVLDTAKRILANIASEIILSQVSKAAQGFDWGGLASSIVGIFGGAVGSGIGSAVGGGIVEGGGNLSSQIAANVHFASGGDHVGGFRLVGENGPELEATGPSRIFNAETTKRILGGAAGKMTNNITINVAAPQGRIEPQSLTQVQAGLIRSLSKAQQRNS